MSLITSLLGGTGDVTTNAANTFTKAPQTINIDAPGNTGLVINGAASQTANILNILNSAGANFLSLAPGNNVAAGSPTLRIGANAAISSRLSTNEANYMCNAVFDGTNFLRISANNLAGLFQLNTTGNLSVNFATDNGTTAGSVITFTERFRVQTDGSTWVLPGASVVGLTVRLAGATTDLQQWQDATPVTHMAVTSTGLLRWTAAGDQQTTVGAAGGASALPATPTKYLKIIDSAGTTLVVPCYAAV